MSGYNTDPVFREGQVVICTNPNGYNFKEGKKYTILKYEPQCADPTFTWPAYVGVENDAGEQVMCHARRFKAETTTKEN